jgi:ligand-binding sensor domain-containing protein
MKLRCHLGVVAGFALLLVGAARGVPDKLADRYSLRLWGREQDFPDTRIRALDFDDEGRLWFATPKGLARFDGVHLNLVTNLPPNITPVRGWLRSAVGSLWIFGVGGVARLTSTGWQNVATTAGGPMRAQAVFTNAAGGLWMVGEKALWRYQGGKLASVEWPAGLPEPLRITSAALDDDEDGAIKLTREEKQKQRQTRRTAPDVVELFNLAEDLGEKNNLAEKQPDKVRELTARLDAFAKEAVSPILNPKPAGGKKEKAVEK